MPDGVSSVGGYCRGDYGISWLFLLLVEVVDVAEDMRWYRFCVIDLKRFIFFLVEGGEYLLTVWSSSYDWPSDQMLMFMLTAAFTHSTIKFYLKSITYHLVDASPSLPPCEWLDFLYHNLCQSHPEPPSTEQSQHATWLGTTFVKSEINYTFITPSIGNNK